MTEPQVVYLCAVDGVQDSTRVYQSQEEAEEHANYINTHTSNSASWWECTVIPARAQPEEGR